jgi:hypothetical protein
MAGHACWKTVWVAVARIGQAFHYRRAIQYSTPARMADAANPVTIDHHKNSLYFRRKALPPIPGSR